MKDGHLTGGVLAVLAAITFGITAPFVKILGESIGPFTTASLLYAGAALVSVSALRGGVRALPGRDAPTLVAVAVLGAALAPASLAWGLQHTTAVTGSLLLNVEAPLTVGLAWLLLREHVGRRLLVALAAMVLGGLLAVVERRGGGLEVSLGAIAVAVAAACWAGDNLLTRRLADRPAHEVVLMKATLGSLVSLTIAIVTGEGLPRIAPASALVGLGAVGYGLSLRLYVMAQRTFGAGRTSSIFAIGPFIGAVLASALTFAVPPLPLWFAAGFFALGVYLHLSERHRHRHVHLAMEHQHLHRHDDGHHDHAHEPPFLGEHSHPHRHEHVVHDHDHAPDLHHRHDH